MRSRVLAVFLLVLLVIPALITACGPSSDGTTTPPIDTTTPPTDTTTPPTDTTTPPQDEELAHPELKRISVEELKQMMDTMQSGLDFVVVDTRDRGSYVYSHIERACNIEYNLFGDPMVRQEMLASLNPQKPIILYCA